jgi:ABC-type Co2+ transport system permease subunit
MEGASGRPSSKRVLLGGLVIVVLWGLAFGWIDDELWTLRNWLAALVAGALFVAMLGVLTYLQSRRRSH